MTTAPTPDEAQELIEWFLAADGFAQGTRAPHKWVLRAEQELRRLRAYNEILRGDYALRGSQIQRMAALIDELEARKPLPPDALADKCEAWLQAGGASNIVDAFEAGYRSAEGITGGSS